MDLASSSLNLSLSGSGFVAWSTGDLGNHDRDEVRKFLVSNVGNRRRKGDP